MYSGCLTDIEGIKAGHYTDANNKTGCTVVLLGDGAVAGVDVRGSAPGTRETDLLRPCNTVQQAHALLLCGGSAFGLAAADGVMRYLEQQGIGFDTGAARVPIVAAAVLYDLAVGSSKVRPDADSGYLACEAACGAQLAQGAVGAAAGATVGKAKGLSNSELGGFGTASIVLPGGAVVAAGFAVNAFGDIFDHCSGQRIKGMRGGTVSNALMRNCAQELFAQNTTIGIVGTNAVLSKEQANKLASAGQDGIAMAIRPAHTMFDGDTVFAFGTGAAKADFNAILAAGAEVCARAIVNAVRMT